jgi:hypothetical protein
VKEKYSEAKPRSFPITNSNLLRVISRNSFAGSWDNKQRFMPPAILSWNELGNFGSIAGSEHHQLAGTARMALPGEAEAALREGNHAEGSI